jgi:hypothetical protein
MSIERDLFNPLIERDDEIREIMDKMEPCYEGHPRLVVALACCRTIAAMLAPAKPKTREKFLARFPEYIRSVMRAIDAMIEERKGLH